MSEGRVVAVGVLTMGHYFDNPVFAGAAGLMASGAIMYLLRSVPIKLWGALISRVTAELVIPNNSPAYHWTEEWMASRPYAKKTRRLKVSQAADNEKKMVLTPGYGRHLFFDGWRPVWFNREAIGKEVRHATPGSADENITITTLDTGRASIEKIYGEIRDAAESRRMLRVLTCSSWGYWSLLLKREHRSLRTVYVETTLKSRIVKHIDWYLANRSWYSDHGIPYRTGILLYGPPGTGKTSLVHAIAGVFDLSVYILNPADLDSESALKSAMASVDRRSILLIEDADESIGCRRAEPKPGEDGPPMAAAPVDKKAGPSLSGVLNALDGIAASDGRILFMTTNHVERLDPALIRDGRIDVRVEVGPLGNQDARAMARSFFPDAAESEIDALIESQGTKTGAEWQTYFANLTKPRAD